MNQFFIWKRMQGGITLKKHYLIKVIKTIPVLWSGSAYHFHWKLCIFFCGQGIRKEKGGWRVWTGKFLLLKLQHVPKVFLVFLLQCLFSIGIMKRDSIINKWKNFFLSKGRLSKPLTCLCIHILVADPTCLLFLQFYPQWISPTRRMHGKRWRTVSLCIQI